MNQTIYFLFLLVNSGNLYCEPGQPIVKSTHENFLPADLSDFPKQFWRCILKRALAILYRALSNAFRWAAKAKDWQLFLASFAFTAIVAFFVQLVFLPYIAPAWHAGNGLLVGLDSVTYHQMAADLAQKIHQQGWSAWTLHSEESAHFGLANITAALYALTVPKPWVLIPLNACLHALSALFLFQILEKLTSRPRALAGALPFLAFPSAALWYSQILKDTYSIAGAFLIIKAWVDLISLDQKQDPLRQVGVMLRALIFIAAGAFLNWIVRPHNVLMLQALALVCFLLMLVILIRQVFYKRARVKTFFFILAGGLAAVWIMTPFTRIELNFGLGMLSQPRGVLAQSEPPPEPTNTPENLPAPDPTKRFPWYPSDLPAQIDNLAYDIADYRHQFTESFPWQTSGIDLETNFESVGDMAAYAPRAILIAFLAPFPEMWLGTGSYAANTVMRRESALEMIFCYAMLLGLPYAVWKWRGKRELWVMLIFCFGMLTFYGLVVSNAGAIYRYRYGFYMPFIGLGVLGWVHILSGLIHNRRTQ